MTKEEMAKRQFYYGQLSHTWIGLAFKYKMAADDVKEALRKEASWHLIHPDAHQPALLMYGYAFEIFAKGYRLALDPSMMSEEALHHSLQHHNPPVDFKKCGLTFDGFETRILDKLKHATEKGRYPVPKSYKDTFFMKPDSEIGMKGDVHPDHVLILPNDYDAIENLWNKIFASYEEKFPLNVSYLDQPMNMMQYFSMRKSEETKPE